MSGKKIEKFIRGLVSGEGYSETSPETGEGAASEKDRADDTDETDEMDDELRWNLDDVAPEGFDGLLSGLSADLASFKGWYSRMSPDMGLDEFRGYLRFSEDVAARADRLYCYGSLMRSEDCSSRKAGRYLAKSEALLLRLAKARAPIERWLSGLDARGKERLDDGNAARLFSAAPDLEYVLWDWREDAGYLLPPEQEEAIAVRESTLLAPMKMRRDSMEAAQRYTLRLPDGKRERDLTYHEFIANEGSPVPETREEFERSLVRGYSRNRNAYVDMFLTSALAWSQEARSRGFPSSISMRNRRNGLPDSVVEAMLSSCMDNREVFQRYFRWRAEKLGVGRLRSCDLEAPLTPDAAEERAIPFREGLETVLASFRRMSGRYASCLEDAVSARHIDSHPRKDKDEDYYTSAIAPGVGPYMLIHWDGGIADVITLAHEGGHFVHYQYANSLPQSSQAMAIPLEETASAFGEQLLFDELLSRAASPEERKALLSEWVGNLYDMVLHKACLTLFEKEAHATARKGWNAKELDASYRRILGEALGESVELTSVAGEKWMMSSDYFTDDPFYTYAYPFGQLVALALHKRLLEEGTAFVPVMERLLSAGGSRPIADLLKEAGMDISRKEFWDDAHSIIRERMDELERL